MANPFDIAEAQLSGAAVAENPFDVAEKQLTQPKIQISPQDAFRAAGGVDPYSNTTDFLGAVANDPKGFVKSLPTAAMAAFTPAGNLLRAGVSDFVNSGVATELAPNLRAAWNNEELPVDRTNRELSKSNPVIATAGKISQGVIGSAPMIAAGMPAGIAGRLISAGFSADMIHGASEAATQLGEEMGKPPEQRDADKITSAISALSQSAVFAPLAGGHAARPRIVADIASEFKRAPVYQPEAPAPAAQPNPFDVAEQSFNANLKSANPTTGVLDDIAANQAATTQRTAEVAASKPAPQAENGTARFADGSVDPVQTALNKLRAEAQPEAAHPVIQKLDAMVNAMQDVRAELQKVVAPEAAPAEQPKGFGLDASALSQLEAVKPSEPVKAPAVSNPSPLDAATAPAAAEAKPSGFTPPKMPERFDTLESALKYRSDYQSSEIAFYKSLGMTDAEAQKMFRAGDGRSNLDVSNIEDKLTPENRARLDAFSTGEGSEMYQWDRQYNPENIAGETDKAELANHVVQNISREDAPTNFGDKLLHAAVAIRQLKEQGGTWSDIARALDSHTTRISGSQGDKAEVFKIYGDQIKKFAAQQGIELPEGNLARTKISQPEVEATKNAPAVEPPKTVTASPPEQSTPNTPRRTFTIRPRSDGVHDILDEVQLQGGIRSPDAADVGGEYDGHKEAMQGTASLLRRRTGGLRPDDMVAQVQTAFPRIKTADDLYEAIKSANAQREKLRTNGGGHEAQTDRFWTAVSQPENAKGVEKITADQLAIGQKFRVKGKGFSHDELEVVHIDADGTVTVKDGTNFGRQDIPDGAEIYIKKGSLVKKNPQTQAQVNVRSTEKVNQPAAIPKLRTGEKGTGSLLQADEPFNLAGERGTDAERVATDKAKAEATKQANEEFQSKSHGDLLKNSDVYSSAYESGKRERDKHSEDEDALNEAVQSAKNGLKMASPEFRQRYQGYLDGLTGNKIKKTADKIADSLESLKTGIGKGGQLHAFGVPALVWDKAIGIAQAVIRAGGSIAEAISSAIAHIKENHKEDFEEQKARFALMEAAQGQLEREIKTEKDQEGRLDSFAKTSSEIDAINADTKANQPPRKPSPSQPKEDVPPERERSLAEVWQDFQDAEKELAKAAVADSAKTHQENQQAKNIAAARYRTVRDELKLHPERIAEVIKEAARVSAEAKAARAAGDTAKAQELESEMQGHADDLARLPQKMVTRIQDELIAKGDLPEMTELRPNAGRTLQAMTDALNKSESDSPKASFLDRLNLAKKAADTFTNGKDLVTKAWGNSVAASKALYSMVKAAPITGDFKNVMKGWIGYDTRTAIENSRYVKALVDKVPQKVRRMAMSVWIDADGDISLLKFQRDAVPAKYLPVWETALKLTPGEKQMALDIKANFAAKLDDGMAVGIIGKGREDYGVPQRWKEAPQTGAGELDPERKGKPGNPYAKLDPRDPFFSFQRNTPSYFEGIMAKGEPEDLDIAHLVSSYDEAFHKALSSRGAIKAFSEATARDGQPVVKISGKADIRTGENAGVFVDSKSMPKDAVTADGRPYVSVDHWALRGWKFAAKDNQGRPIIVRGDMLVHPDHADFLRNELNTPRWTTKQAKGVEKIGRAALQASSYLKASKFIGPFHIVTEALHASFHGVVPSVKGFEINLDDASQSLLSRNMMIDMGRAREMYDDGVRQAGGGVWKHVPGLGDAIVRMNNFTFNEYIPKLKMKVGLAVLERNRARYADKLTDDQIAEITGRQMDAAFGGQNWRLMGANKNVLAVTRLGLVAPDFLISRAKVIGQALKPYGREQQIFLLAQAVGVYTLARILNSIFSDDHDPHFEPHSWDRVVIGKRSYAARFIVSDAANLARDLLGLGSFSQHGIPFVTGRLGVLPKMGMEVASGKDLFTGQNKDGLFDASSPALKAFSIMLKDASEWMTPMGVDGFMPGAAAKGQSGLGSAIVATVGVSSKKENAAGDMWNAAREFNLNSKDANEARKQKQRDEAMGKPSDYRALDNLLDAGRLDLAKQEFERLKADGRSTEQIVNRYNKNTYFAGSAAQETKFYNSLDDAQKKTLQEARAEHKARVEAFAKMLKQ